MDTVKKRKLFKFHPRDVPWSTRAIREQEFAKIIGIEFETKSSISLICLKVNLIYLKYCIYIICVIRLFFYS